MLKSLKIPNPSIGLISLAFGIYFSMYEFYYFYKLTYGRHIIEIALLFTMGEIFFPIRKKDSELNQKTIQEEQQIETQEPNAVLKKKKL